MEINSNKIPVTIVTGFLGTGKTTFINHIIESYKDTRFAVIENEFGEISIDSELIINTDGNIYELTNGCVCCTLNDELLETLSILLESGHNPGHVIIETTGLADPDALAASFSSEFFDGFFEYNGTICLADAAYFDKIMMEIIIAQKQVAFADIVILNKSDTVDDQKIDELGRVISSLNPFAVVHKGVNGKTTSGDILDIEKVIPSNSFMDATRPKQDQGHLLESISLRYEPEIRLDDFVYEMDILLRNPEYKIYRMKGIINAEGSDRKAICQSAGRKTKVSDGGIWLPGDKRISEIVFIGKNPDRKSIGQIIKSCLSRMEI